MMLKNNYTLWKLKIQGTQKNEGKPKSKKLFMLSECEFIDLLYANKINC